MHKDNLGEQTILCAMGNKPNQAKKKREKKMRYNKRGTAKKLAMKSTVNSHTVCMCVRVCVS